jgi:hypothetical protein
MATVQSRRLGLRYRLEYKLAFSFLFEFIDWSRLSVQRLNPVFNCTCFVLQNKEDISFKVILVFK